MPQVQKRLIHRQTPTPGDNQRQTARSGNTPLRSIAGARLNASRESRPGPWKEASLPPSSPSTSQQRPQATCPWYQHRFPLPALARALKSKLSAVSARIAIHAGAASRSESGKRFEGLSAFKSNVVFDFGEECVRVCVVKLQPWERYLALVSVYNTSVPKNKAERKHQMSVRLAPVHVA